jgi:uncharacterized protein (UPF0297 family)
LSLGNFTSLYLRAEDKMLRWGYHHQNKLSVKKILMMKVYKRLRDGGINLVQDRMMGPG